MITNLLTTIKTKIIFALLFLLTIINSFSQNNVHLSLYSDKDNCIREHKVFDDTSRHVIKYITYDSSYHLFHSEAYDRTCVFKYDRKTTKYIYDTSYSSDFSIKYGRFGKTHFITKNIGYRKHILRFNNNNKSHSIMFKTYNSGINWNILVDLDKIDQDYYHSIDDFYCIDSNTIVLYGKQLKYKLKENNYNHSDKYKNYVNIFPNGKIDTHKFNYIEFSTFIFISHDGGKNWDKIDKNINVDLLDIHRFDIKINSKMELFKTSTESLNIVKISHSDKNRQIILINKKNKKFYINY